MVALSLASVTLPTSQRVAVPRRSSLVVRATAQQQGSLSRREATLAAAAAALAVFAPRPAHAIFGLGDNKKAEEEYATLTAKIIADVLEGSQLPKDAPGREQRLYEIRDEMNAWVAKYRRDAAYSGRPSYGNTYSAVNALAGHLNSFGYTSPVPKKRLERLVKELGDAEKQLARGR